MKKQPQSYLGLDRKIGVFLVASTTTRRLGVPFLDGIGQEPEGKITPLDGRKVVLGPVADAVLGLVVRVDSGAFARHRRSPWRMTLISTRELNEMKEPCPDAAFFATLEAAREWIGRFVVWYNTTHRHSGMKYVTPEQRHLGDDRSILKKREKVYAAAKARNPERWSGKGRNWRRIDEVRLNPEDVGSGMEMAG